PENIMRTAAGETKILDFGMARFLPAAGRPSAGLEGETAATRLTEPGSIVGTVAYMSPEQLEGKEGDFRSDIFSFGVLLYELATRAHPFEGATPASTIVRIMTGEPVPLAQRNPVAPPELERIVRKCLRKRPEERYQSTHDLAVDLEQLRRESGERRPAAGAPGLGVEEGEASLLPRFFSAWGLTPRRWWEMDTLAGFAVFYPLMIYFGWKVKEWQPGGWALGLFFAMLVAVALPAALRVFLASTAAFNPRALASEVWRWARWLRYAHLAMLALLLVMAASVATAHTGFAALLMGFTVAGAVAVLVIHPAIDRAAFPSIAAAAQPVRAGVPVEFRLVAGIQLVYWLPTVVFFTQLGSILEEVWVSKEGQPYQIEFGVFVAVLLAAIVIGGATAVAMWRGNRKSVETFCRWFPLYLLVDLPGITTVVGFGIVFLKNLGVGLLVLAVLVYLPFWQRRLARKILAGGGG
ncbi:MAG: serine/threonine protein kinase, partial [Terriglobia bacterium]